MNRTEPNQTRSQAPDQRERRDAFLKSLKKISTNISHACLFLKIFQTSSEITFQCSHEPANGMTAVAATAHASS